MITERELKKIETELFARICSSGETGGLAVSSHEAADFATRHLLKMLSEYKTLRDAHLTAIGQTRRALAYV